ncbi:lipopolysaccharide transport periplasmic protein LptA [Lampropedia puyangensis]|uniref:Lipopolysaccharide export system protein LptA n=1 Tax=Lampropedia puyangensis TaxID=1330072 RepID=A0A4V4GSE5_9BURK|nr:lipopolysaccharide transport periplasmic protein LptA [Lampropedia puyangensis]THU04446.1 lipopolysaccharide transport periplasmic protein LptA [Lampropedia puyangensis]
MRQNFPTLALCAAVFALCLGSAHALESDRDQPMNIEANTMRHDDAKQVTVFSGAVVVTKGSMVLRGDTVTVEQRADGSQFGVAQAEDGRRAFFSQERDTAKGAPQETMEAQAQRIEYDTKADRVRLVGQTQLRRLVGGKFNDEITGGEIIYYNATGMFTVDGAARQAPESAKSSGRVRAVIGANTTSGSKGATAQPSSSAPSAAGRSSIELKTSPDLDR